MSDQPRTLSRASIDRPRWNPEFGAVRVDDGVQFRVWASAARRLTLFVRHGDVVRAAGSRRESATESGSCSCRRRKSLPGSRYAYAIDERRSPAGSGEPLPTGRGARLVRSDRSRASPGPMAHGAASTRTGSSLYELHVGTFSPAGTFAGVTERLAYLRDLGITAIELMPLADFPGRRNWGYDGASLFAPSRAYGRPEDLRALVDRAHALGIAVLIDVVYNHLGPEGAYLPAFSPEFLTTAHQTPWGSAVNLDREGSADHTPVSDRERAALDPRVSRRRSSARRHACVVRRRSGAVRARADARGARRPRSASDGVRGGPSQPCDHGEGARGRGVGTRRSLGRRLPPRRPAHAGRRCARVLRRLRGDG